MSHLDRRTFLRATLIGAGASLVGCNHNGVTLGDASAGPLSAMPYSRAPATTYPGGGAQACQLTADNIEGPYYKAGAPDRNTLAGEGTQLVLSGRVLGIDCAPIARAQIDVWHADKDGGYDNDGFEFRGKLRCDDEGCYTLYTIVPGRYLNGRRYRPAHIHVKLSAPGLAPLTTQLYFAGDPYNEGDPFIDESLIMQPTARDGGLAAAFDFVLPRA